MIIIGVDLSGPANHKDTAAALFKMKDDYLECLQLEEGLSDKNLLDIISSIREPAVLAIDAPLSYQDGGGDRSADAQFRKFISSIGMHHGSIMAPTMTKMVYLTLRGIALTRMIEQLNLPIQIVEVHPGAAMYARLQPDDKKYGLSYKKDEQAARFLLNWLQREKLMNIPWRDEVSSHAIDACGAALAGWNLVKETPLLFIPKSLPHHPYDFCC
ncbi:DUF429 domain-containing protein [Metabacillus sp. GX 13764]|uniref:DUF429 domain-containing protein n=1 Tax=Metabacillus kandeliae TaxID=2900151 RepID=UPI001E648D53|nr:DUF429 domain-containing protein [Metabacillus kandeliae]MCD7036492.1 DUF429 domain-containing protein [Metabacillus kandeliae]